MESDGSDSTNQTMGAEQAPITRLPAELLDSIATFAVSNATDAFNVGSVSRLWRDVIFQGVRCAKFTARRRNKEPSDLLSLVSGFGRLNHLSLHSSNVRDADFEKLDKLRSLEILCLEKCFSFAPRVGFSRFLRQNPRLKSLLLANVSGWELPGRDSAPIGEKLEFLALMNSDLSGVRMVDLGYHFPRLKLLALGGSKTQSMEEFCGGDFERLWPLQVLELTNWDEESVERLREGVDRLCGKRLSAKRTFPGENIGRDDEEIVFWDFFAPLGDKVLESVLEGSDICMRDVLHILREEDEEEEEEYFLGGGAAKKEKGEYFLGGGDAKKESFEEEDFLGGAAKREKGEYILGGGDAKKESFEEESLMSTRTKFGIKVIKDEGLLGLERRLEMAQRWNPCPGSGLVGGRSILVSVGRGRCGRCVGCESVWRGGLAFLSGVCSMTSARRPVLVEAAMDGDERRVMALLGLGADPNVRDAKGNSALHRAAENGHAQCVSAVLAAHAKNTANFGTSVWTQNHRLESPLWLASLRATDSNTPSVAIVRLLARAERLAPESIRRLWIQRSAKTGDEWSVLHACAVRGSVSAAKAVGQVGYDFAATNRHGQTPLHIAANRGSTDLAMFLVRQGVKPDAPDTSGRTPLEDAILTGQTTLANTLSTITNQDPDKLAKKLSKRYRRKFHLE